MAPPLAPPFAVGDNRAMRACMLVPLLLTAACWQPRYFMPRENLNGSGPDGDPAAVYALPDGPGAAVGAAKAGENSGELRLWSRGAAAHYDDKDQEVVDLRIGFELENNGAEPLRLDLAGLRCDELMVEGLLQPPLSPERIDGDGLAAPGSTAHVEAWFRPPAKAPRKIESFSVRWRVLRADGSAMSQVTPFGVLRRPDPDPAWRPGYLWAPAFGFGWGLGWHFH